MGVPCTNKVWYGIEVPLAAEVALKQEQDFGIKTMRLDNSLDDRMEIFTMGGCVFSLFVQVERYKRESERERVYLYHLCHLCSKPHTCCRIKECATAFPAQNDAVMRNRDPHLGDLARDIAHEWCEKRTKSSFTSH